MAETLRAINKVATIRRESQEGIDSNISKIAAEGLRLGYSPHPTPLATPAVAHHEENAQRRPR